MGFHGLREFLGFLGGNHVALPVIHEHRPGLLVFIGEDRLNVFYCDDRASHYPSFD